MKTSTFTYLAASRFLARIILPELDLALAV